MRWSSRMMLRQLIPTTKKKPARMLLNSRAGQRGPYALYTYPRPCAQSPYRRLY
jgi:hypothetical protein